MEIWKDAPGFPGYQVSASGRVKRTTKGGKELRPVRYSNGYCVVNLSGKRIGVHRLVALAFIPNPKGLPEINHKDEDKQNNNVNNLEWCDRVYNNNYGSRTLRASVSRSCPVKQLSLTGEIISVFYGIHEADRQTGIDYRNIHRVLSGRRKTAGRYRWEYV